MSNHQQDTMDGTNRIGGFLAGVLFGGLAGVGAALLFAPQSGEKTRAQIQAKTIELRDQTVKSMEDAAAEVRSKANEITSSMQKQAEDLQQRGQDLLTAQKERWSPVVEAGKTAVQG
jgi:gas vesicle protein